MTVEEGLYWPTPAFWGLDPLFWTPPLLYIHDILHALTPTKEFPEVMFYKNHPLKTVEIAGLVVAIDRKTHHAIYSRASIPSFIQ